MAHRGYSNWDRWIGTGRLFSCIERQPSEGTGQARCRARIAAFESPRERAGEYPASLSVELTSRRDFWRDHLAKNYKLFAWESSEPFSANRMVLLVGLVVITLATSAAFAQLVPLFIGRPVLMPHAAFLIVPVLIVLVLIALFKFTAGPRDRIMSSLSESTCPDCSYSLEELPDAIELPGDERTGPAVCPECGCPWPLIPPRPRT